MNKVKHILAILIVLTILSAAAYFLPKTQFGAEILQNTPSTTEISSTDIAQDTTLFIDKFKNKLEVLQSSYSKRKKREFWTLGKGRTITYYLLQAQKFLKANGGQVLYMEELHDDPTVFQAALLDATTPNGDTLHLTLQVSENIFRDNASYLSVSFQVTTLTPELIIALNALDFPYDLMITPYGMPDSFFPDLDRIKDKELVLWLLMESTNLDSRHRKLRPIRIHHTQQQIENIITEAKKLVPQAKGIATRFAEQAVEHKQLLQAAFEPTKDLNLWFIDLSMNQKSKVTETCKDYSIRCKTLSPYNPSNSALDDYIKQKLRGAARNGMAAMILPLTTECISKVKTIKDKAANQGTTIVNLSTFMRY